MVEKEGDFSDMSRIVEKSQKKKKNAKTKKKRKITHCQLIMCISSCPFRISTLFFLEQIRTNGFVAEKENVFVLAKKFFYNNFS